MSHYPSSSGIVANEPPPNLISTSSSAHNENGEIDNGMAQLAALLEKAKDRGTFTVLEFVHEGPGRVMMLSPKCHSVVWFRPSYEFGWIVPADLFPGTRFCVRQSNNTFALATVAASGTSKQSIQGIYNALIAPKRAVGRPNHHYKVKNYETGEVLRTRSSP